MGPCYRGMAGLRVTDAEHVFHIRRVATNILNKQSRTADKGLSSRLWIGSETDNSSAYKNVSYKSLTGPRILVASLDRDQWRTVVNTVMNLS
jgi:hypothetical protein